MSQVDPQYGGFTFNNSTEAGVSVTQPPPAYQAVYSNPSTFPGAAQLNTAGGAMTAPAGHLLMHQLNQVRQQGPKLVCENSRRPVPVCCPYCNTFANTMIQKEVSSRSYKLAACLCCMLMPCAIPCVWEQSKDVIHFCGSCRKEIGRYIPRSSPGL